MRYLIILMLACATASAMPDGEEACADACQAKLADGYFYDPDLGVAGCRCVTGNDSDNWRDQSTSAETRYNEEMFEAHESAADQFDAVKDSAYVEIIGEKELGKFSRPEPTPTPEPEPEPEAQQPEPTDAE